MEPVESRVSALAAAIASRYGAATRAVLFYGSCLRDGELDGRVLDFYVIVSTYRQAYGAGWLAVANWAVPPNVFPFRHNGLSAKYAVLSEADFRVGCGPDASDVSVWARFAQPSRLVWASDDAAVDSIVDSLSSAAATLVGYTRPRLRPESADDPLAIWERGLRLTYSCELRAERVGRSASIVSSDPERYRRFTAAILVGERPLATSAHTEAKWRKFRRRGKILTVARLVKAATTYTGGVDYLAGKINRHTGIEVKPWHRRWPVIGAIALLPRLLKRGAIR